MFDAETKERHLRLLANAWANNAVFNEGYEWGYWGNDPKRPFGNGDVAKDVLEIIGVSWEPNDDGGVPDDFWNYAMTLYKKDLGPYIKKLILGEARS